MPDGTTFTDDELADVLRGQVPPPPQPEPRQLTFAPDLDALNASSGDADTWGRELTRLYAAVTGAEVDPLIAVSWLRSYADQVVERTWKDALFRIANTALPAHIHGDPATLLLRMRDQLVAGLRAQAGMEEQ